MASYVVKTQQDGTKNLEKDGEVIAAGLKDDDAVNQAIKDDRGY